MVFAEKFRKQNGRKYGTSEKIAQDRLDRQSDNFALACIWLSSPLRTGLVRPSSTAVLVEMGALFRE